MAIFTECKGGEGLSPLAGVVDERKFPTNYRALLRGLDSFTRISASRLYLMSGNKGEARIFTILQPVCWHSGLKGQPSNLLTLRGGIINLGGTDHAAEGSTKLALERWELGTNPRIPPRPLM